MKTACLMFAFCTFAATTAQAQMTWTDKGFLNVNLGVQAGSRDLASSTEFPLHDETARLDSTQEIGGGAFFDVSAGYKVWRNLALGAGFSRTKSDADVAIAASIPDPDVTDRPRNVTASATGAEHSEFVFYITGTWMVPVTDKVDVGLSFGPAIFNVGQDLPVIEASDVTEPGPTITPRLTEVSKTSMGIHFGADMTYLVTPRIGVGGLVRYTWASADLEGATESLTVGGFQIGGGLRVRF
jgi:hypothetical protein